MENDDDRGGRGLAHWFDDLLFRFETWQPRPTLALGFGVLALCALTIGWLYGRAAEQTPVESRIPLASADPSDDGIGRSGAGDGAGGPAEVTDEPSGGSPAAMSEPAPASEAPLVVHVAGAVVRSGLVRLPAGARVHDAVVAAGGPSVEADLDRLNLAAPLADGMQVRVPEAGEEVAGPLLLTPAAGSGGSSESAAGSGPVDLNTASAEALDTLPGVGPATASAIMSWREENGGFRSLDDLLSVPGIGPAKLAALRDHVTV